MKSLLRQQPPLLFLGSRHGLIPLIRTLNADLGIEPCVLARTRPLAPPGLPRFRFIKLRLPGNDYCTLSTLLALAEEERGVRTTLLVPCSPGFEEFINRNSDEIEAAFIVLPFKSLPGLLPGAAKIQVYQ